MSHQTKVEMLADLEDRLERAVRNLEHLEATTYGQRERLLAKRDGVKLALSYVQEIRR